MTSFYLKDPTSKEQITLFSPIESSSLPMTEAMDHGGCSLQKERASFPAFVVPFLQSSLTGLLVSQAHALGQSMLPMVGLGAGGGALMGHA